nr:trypco2 family protein [Limimaricola variabilis]
MKEFVTETVSAIADATAELQERYAGKGVLVNPPTNSTGEQLFVVGREDYHFRYVEKVEFDVALTVGSTKQGEGKAGIRIASVEIGGGGSKSVTSEAVSRVRFTIPLALSPTAEEGQNLGRSREEDERFNREMAKRHAGYDLP